MAKRKGARMPKRFTMQSVDELFERAQGGDERAEEQLRSEAARLAKKVNRQIREFENLGRTSAAYQRAEYYLSQEKGAERFREKNKTQDLQELVEDVEQMIRFTSSEGYSLKKALEEEEQVEKNRGAIRAALGEIPDDEINFILNDMFKTEAWKEMRKSFGAGTDLIQMATDAFKRGRTVDDLIAAYDEYKSGEDENFDITKAWTRFTGERWSMFNRKRRR